MINTNKQFIPYQNQVKDFRNNKMQINYNNQVQNNLNNPNTHIKMKTDMNILDKQNSPQKILMLTDICIIKIYHIILIIKIM